MPKNQKVAVLIPAYNEGRVVGQVIKDLHRALVKAKFNFEIVLVDDGSSDETAKLATQAGATVVRHILNTGSGGATATSLSYAKGQGFSLAATLDADGQHDPDDVVNGIKIMMKGGVDLLIGSRLANEGDMSRVKVLGNKGLSIITYILFGINVADSQSGLRIFSKKAIDNLRWQTSGYEYCSEMLWRARQQGLIIKEYPIKAIYTDYSKSKGQNNWNAFNIVKTLLTQRVMELLGE